MAANITLSVEFLAGTSIETAIKEASELARKLDIAFVQFSFNGVNCSISQNPDMKELVTAFQQAVKTGSYLIG